MQRESEAHSSQNTTVPVNAILHFQRTIGNRAVAGLLQSGNLQKELNIGQPGNRYEREAGLVASKVVSMPEPSVQRQPEAEEEMAQAARTPVGPLPQVRLPGYETMEYLER